ncbi:hypothetical protein D3C86_2085990 [compost metagenome]
MQLAITLNTLQNLVGPWTCCIDEKPGTNLFTRTRVNVFQRYRPSFMVTASGYDFGACADHCTTICCVTRG